jgi:hypothetical protein
MLDYHEEMPRCQDGWYWAGSNLWLIEFLGNGEGYVVDFDTYAEHEALGYGKLTPSTPAIELDELGLTRAATCAEVEVELDKVRDEFDSSWREDRWTTVDRLFDERNGN